MYYMSNIDIYNYNDYQSFLEAICDSKGKRSGFKTKMAKAVQVQSAYLSRVLNKKVNLNLEQGFRLSKFLGLGEKERAFLFLLIEKERAGTAELQDYFLHQIEEEAKKHNQIESRIKYVDELTSESKAQYYSNWYYLTIHLMAEMDSIKNAEDIAKRLNLNLETVNEVLSFLSKYSLISFDGDIINSTDISVHLSGDSPLITQHHRNWRLKALQEVSKTTEDHLHFSAATTINYETYSKIRKLVLKTIEDSVELLQQSPIEDLYVFNIDWYKM